MSQLPAESSDGLSSDLGLERANATEQKALIVVLATAVIALLGGFYLSWLLPIALSVLSTAVFNVAVGTYSRQHWLRVVRAESSAMLREFTERLANSSPQPLMKYAPTRAFDPSNEPQPGFNQEVGKGFVETEEYFFRGTSAKHTAVRLMQTKRHPSSLYLVLDNPQDQRAVHIRALDKKAQPRHSQKQVEEIEREIRSEILMALVGLFDHRLGRTVTIAFALTPSVIRAEIFDHAAFVTLIDIKADDPFRFPETLRYDRGTDFYTLFKRDIQAQINSSHTPIVMDRNFTGHQLADIVHSLAHDAENTPGETLAKYRTRFQAFSKQDQAYLQQAGQTANNGANN
jgi:hypothetical protein